MVKNEGFKSKMNYFFHQKGIFHLKKYQKTSKVKRLKK